MYSQLVIFFWLILIGFWIVSALGYREGKSAGGLRSSGFRIGLLILVILLFRSQLSAPLTGFFARYSTFAFGPNGQLVGVILCGLGIAFAIWARIHIGRNWGMPMTLRKGQELVTSGPYEFVRHPIYTGILLALFGSALVYGLYWFILLALFDAYFIFSAKKEEKDMLKRFPKEYPGYMKRSKMLIPFVF